MIFKKFLGRKRKLSADERLKIFSENISNTLEKIASSDDIGTVSDSEIKFAKMQPIASSLSVQYHDTRFVEVYRIGVNSYISMTNTKVEELSTLRKIGDEVRADLSESFYGHITVQEALDGTLGREHGEEKPYETLTHVDQEPDNGIVRTNTDYTTPDDNQ